VILFALAIRSLLVKNVLAERKSYLLKGGYIQAAACVICACRVAP